MDYSQFSRATGSISRWRDSRLASAAGTTGSSCANGRSRRPARLMACTRLTPPMFSHFLVRPRRRRRPSLPDTISTFLLALVIVIAMWSGGVEGNSGCKVDHCTRQFQQAAMMSGVRRGPSPAFCVILRQYSDCLRSTARSCRGHLAYHSTITLVQNWNGDFNCSYVGGSSAPAPLPVKRRAVSAITIITRICTRPKWRTRIRTTRQ
ncbi:hypothetical protein GHT06_018287 [Daphnia sinensis]|uniref:Repulsive guidance molecule N-terminal domain-containing protein n=1 Tax=Daphnia sinensis TaxID=1820382 RepID=A0AAD5KMB1_9CRUS|nr:hypothetical protein GHT06_018287 [Daphnia sinensis]